LYQRKVAATLQYIQYRCIVRGRLSAIGVLPFAPLYNIFRFRKGYTCSIHHTALVIFVSVGHQYITHIRRLKTQFANIRMQQQLSTICTKAQPSITQDQSALRLDQKWMNMDKQRGRTILRVMYFGIKWNEFLSDIDRKRTFKKGVNLYHHYCIVNMRVTQIPFIRIRLLHLYHVYLRIKQCVKICKKGGS